MVLVSAPLEFWVSRILNENLKTLSALRKSAEDAETREHWQRLGMALISAENGLELGWEGISTAALPSPRGDPLWHFL